MKRGLALLLTLALCLSFAACGKSGAPQGGDTPADMPDASEATGGAAPADVNREPAPVFVGEALNVEFVAGERDIDELLALQSEFPQALIDALAQENLVCDAVVVTFGTSDEATLLAVQTGAVDIGFVTAETAVAEYPDGIAAIGQSAEPDLASGVVVLGEDWAGASWDPAAVLCGAVLPRLAPVLARYTGEEQGGVYVPLTDAVFEQLRALYEAEQAELTAP